MSAKVTILSEIIEEALQIPLPAIFKQDGVSYCLVGKEGEEMSLRTIELGSNNLSMAVVTAGLQAGEQVVINPDPFRDAFALPEPKDFAKN